MADAGVDLRLAFVVDADEGEVEVHAVLETEHRIGELAEALIRSVLGGRSLAGRPGFLVVRIEDAVTRGTDEKALVDRQPLLVVAGSPEHEVQGAAAAADDPDACSWPDARAGHQRAHWRRSIGRREVRAIEG